MFEVLDFMTSEDPFLHKVYMKCLLKCSCEEGLVPADGTVER